MSKTETWDFPPREQRQQDERAALNDCLARLNAIEHAPTPVHDAGDLDEALSAYFCHADRGKAAQVVALHRLIASYIGSRKSTPMSDKITSHLTAVLQRLAGDA